MSDWQTKGVTLSIPNSVTVKPAHASGQVRRSGNEGSHNQHPSAGLNSLRNAMKAIADQLNAYARENDRALNFNIDESSGRVVVSVLDGATGELIRQIPSKQALALARNLATNGLSLLDAGGLRA